MERSNVVGNPFCHPFCCIQASSEVLVKFLLKNRIQGGRLKVESTRGGEGNRKLMKVDSGGGR